ARPGRRRRALGRTGRLVAAALLRLGRHPLHALPGGVVRDGAARGDELRRPRGGQPHLRLPAAHGARSPGPARGPLRRRGPLRPGAAVPAGPPRRTPAHGAGGPAHGGDPLLLAPRRGRARGPVRGAAGAQAWRPRGVSVKWRIFLRFGLVAVAVL